MKIGIKEASVLALAAALGIAAFEYWPSGQTVTAKAPTTPTAAQAAQVECARKEFSEFSQASIARLNEKVKTPARMLSVESILVERRLDEQHCLRLASCFYPDPQSLEYGAYFSTCLAPERPDDN